ncbi:MAG: hypothetical protein ACK2U5_00210 [Candidatus Promineifilaceae bacterium]
MSDLDLLRRFEPVIRYTSGEMFFPCSVDAYLARCSLWRRDEDGVEMLLVPRGGLDPESLVAFDYQLPGSELSLRFVDAPLDPIAYQRWLNRSDRPLFDSAGRLARVGFVGRLAETLFDLSLLLRGRVAGGTAARAEMLYREMFTKEPDYVYYGRVLRDSGYTILHYLFFYPMNDWRSSFHGVNDHESDWEQIFVFLSEEEGDYQPQWVAFAAHDFSGDDLRRRWDDPELQKVNEDHVVVFAGAGSHAAYVTPGEYLMNFEPAFLQPVSKQLRPVRRYFAESLGSSATASLNDDAPLISLAFVDYARGDGLAIGPQQSAQWSPQLLSDELPWVSSYRGLWGLDTRDPFGGERAPAGPKFDRNGSVRHAWRDPLGWSGLDKVPTPGSLTAEIKAQVAALGNEAQTVGEEIELKRRDLRAAGMIALAISHTPNLEEQSKLHAETMLQTEAELAALTARQASLEEDMRVLHKYLARVREGDLGEPQAHLRHKAVPQAPPPGAKLLDTWAAISGALLVSTIILLLAIRPPFWLLWVLLTLLIFGMIEAALRERLARFLLSATVIMALIGSAVLIWEYWRWVIPAALLFIFIFSLLSNLRELRARRVNREQ